MDELTGTAGIVALAAAAVALLALVVAGIATVRLHRLRVAQQVILGDSGARDLVAHAAGLQRAFSDLHSWMDESASRLDERMQRAEERLDGAIAYRALVRYDAYGELTGHQSTTIALLDDHRNGIVISAIANRETARLYCKQVHDGTGDVDLSPEETEAVRLALAGERQAKILTQ